MGKLKLLVKIFLSLVLLPAGLIGAFYFLNNNGFFNIDGIDIVVDNSAEQSVYLQPLVKSLDAQMESLRGISLWKVDLQKLNVNLSQLSWIQDLNISRSWPSKVLVHVHAKEVNLLLMTHEGRFVPIVESGESLAAVDLKQIPDVAVLRGENFEKRTDLRRRAVQFLKEIPSQGNFSRKSISEIHYDDHDGFWTTLIKDGIQVKMGQDQIVTKSARVSQVLEYIDSRKIDARVIDANLSKKVLVRLRKDP